MYPFGTAMVLVVIGLVARYFTTFDVTPGNVLQTHNVLWLFALGWAIERAANARQRALVAACAVVGVTGFFGDATRELVVLLGLALLILLPRLPVPRRLHAVIGAIAGGSLYVYLTQFEVYPLLLLAFPPVVVVPMTIAIGVGIERGVVAVRARRHARGRPLRAQGATLT
jgi:hypothetical protein